MTEGDGTRRGVFLQPESMAKEFVLPRNAPDTIQNVQVLLNATFTMRNNTHLTKDEYARFKSQQNNFINLTLTTQFMTLITRLIKSKPK